CSTLPRTTASRTAVIIDDVVASGQTSQRVAFLLKTRLGIKKVIMATWLFAYPSSPENKKVPSGIEGVDQTFASIVLKGNYLLRPPINSLSCFIRNEGKYEQVKNDFIQRYITDQQLFQDILDQIKEATL
ncbi:MAG: phosphoribosyltransferase, partial [Candidatus Levybacteria bacterium]|nr:phosphoribosyltransferase [Candidatus Levybacteria bacterium]